MAKKNTPQLIFIAQAEIQVQEASPIERKEKGTLMTFPMAKITLPAYLHSQGEIQVRKRSLKKKKVKGTLMTFPMAKTPSSQLTFIAQAEIQVQEASPIERKEKGTLMTFPMAQKHPPSLPS
jgi:hypothetical protein